MLSIELRLKVDGRDVHLDALADMLVTKIVNEVRLEQRVRASETRHTPEEMPAPTV